jgi:hypothetical protein
MKNNSKKYSDVEENEPRAIEMPSDAEDFEVNNLEVSHKNLKFTS